MPRLTPGMSHVHPRLRTTLVAHNPGESGGSGSAVVALALSAAALEEACADDPLLDAWWARLSSDVLLHHGSGVTHGADSAIARRVSVAGGNLQGLLGREARAPKEGDRRSQRGGGRAKGAGDSGGGGITGVIRRASVRLGLTPAPGGPEDKEEGAFAVLGSALRRAAQFGMDSLTAFNSKGKKGGRTNTNIKM